jgi:hypothetical protein
MAIKAGFPSPSAPQPLRHHPAAQPPPAGHCKQGRSEERKGATAPLGAPTTPERRRPPPTSSPTSRRVPRHGEPSPARPQLTAAPTSFAPATTGKPRHRLASPPSTRAMAAVHAHPRRRLLPLPLASAAHLHTHACTQHTPRPGEQVPAMRDHHEPRAEAPLATAMGALCPHSGHGTNPPRECPRRHLEHLSHSPTRSPKRHATRARSPARHARPSRHARGRERRKHKHRDAHSIPTAVHH